MFDRDWFSRSIIKIISYITKPFKFRYLNSNPLHASYYHLCYYYNGYIEEQRVSHGCLNHLDL